MFSWWTWQLLRSALKSVEIVSLYIISLRVLVMFNALPLSFHILLSILFWPRKHIYVSFFPKVFHYLPLYEPLGISHNFRKRTFVHVRPAKIQISLRIRAVWSKSSLGAFWIAKDAKLLHADHEDTDPSVRMRRLIWVFVGRTSKGTFSDVAAYIWIRSFIRSVE